MACHWLLSVLGWTLVLSIQFSYAENADEASCDLFFIEQPLTQHTCNPYIGGIRLRCTVYQREGLSEDLSIHWYRSLMNNVTQPELVEPRFVRRDSRSVMTSLFTLSPESEDVGLYWCQIVGMGPNVTVNSTYPPSQQYSLLPLSVYENYPPCTRQTRLSGQSSTCVTDGAMLAPLPSLSSSDEGANDSSEEEASPVVTETGKDVALISVCAILSFFLIALTILLIVIACVLKSKIASGKSMDNEAGSVASSEITLNEEPLTTVGDLEDNTLDTSYHKHQDQVVSSLTEHSPLPVSSPPSQQRNASSYVDVSGYNTFVIVHRDIEYCVVDPEKKDEHIYTNRCKPPPVMPKKPGKKNVKPLNNHVEHASNRLPLLLRELPVSDLDKKYSGQNTKSNSRDAAKLSLCSDAECTNVPDTDVVRHHYQSLTATTKDYLNVYSNPVPSIEHLVYHHAESR